MTLLRELLTVMLTMLMSSLVKVVRIVSTNYKSNQRVRISRHSTHQNGRARLVVVDDPLVDQVVVEQSKGLDKGPQLVLHTLCETNMSG